MKEKKVWLECKECKSQEVKAERIVKYKGSWRSRAEQECLCHDGWGWELDEFTFKCAKCNSENISVEWER